MPARWAPPPPPRIRRSGSRTPKNCDHSEPEYVVGTDTRGSPDAAEAALAVSIALPPPTARMPSTPPGTSIRWEGISSQRAAAGSSRRSQRRDATRNERRISSSASSSGSASRPQTTRMSEPLAREGDERLGDARRPAARRADERDLPRRLEPLDPRLRDRTVGEVGLNRRSRDEADAEPRAYSDSHGLLHAELQADVEVAQPHAGAAQLVLDHLADSGALLHQDQRLLLQLLQPDGPAGEAVIRRADEDDLVPEERLERDAAVPPGCADDAELELAARDEVDDRLRVVHRERHVDVRVAPLKLAQQERQHGLARAGRGAQLQPPPQRTAVARRDLVHELLLQREQALRAAVQP